MTILLLEEAPLLRSAITRQLTEQGVPADRIHYNSHPGHSHSGLLALLQQQAFSAIICQQDKQQGLEGARLLHEAHYLSLLQPGCVLLLLDADQSEQDFLPSDLYFSLYLPLPFITQQLTVVLEQLVKLSSLTRSLAAPILLREWQLATALCEDLLFQREHRSLAPWLDRLKGYLLLQSAEGVAAAQHYALCANEYLASWPRAGFFYAMLGLGKLQNAQTDLQRHQAKLPAATRLELQLASQLHQHQWQAAWETMGELQQIRPHQPRWHQLAMLLGLVQKNEEKALEQANSLTLRHFTEQHIRLTIDGFMLNASLAVLWGTPSGNRLRSLQQQWDHLKRTTTLEPHEYGLLHALMLGLEYRFDEALILIARHQPDDASDNHLALLLGFAVSQFCGLPHHAQRYLTQLTHYRTRVAPHPLTRQLFHHLVTELGQRLTAREQRLSELRQLRHKAMQARQYQTALQAGLQLLEEFPALPGDAWHLLELLQHGWPAGMAAPRVSLLVDTLERRLKHSPAFLDQHGQQYQRTLHEVRTHLQPHLSGSGPSCLVERRPES
ncbi:hypothetical protein CJP16_18060 [Aeromonas sobria]|uniref:Response regulatory domain-containing protein n=1 Tax=Aeromonas sobria TaxID=646 RepID=A0A2N3IQG3_AERSO|nr:hypothetical protein [Aeromonas sobria]PKQ73711.1 hypothetical protein CJP16_18060 [Aeromonas sobria]